MEEIIEESAKKYADSIPQDGHKKDYCVVDFEAGAKWALQNQWHDASKELPEDNKMVIVLTEKGNAVINSVYTFNGYRQWHSNYKVSYWMSIPSLPVKLK